MVTRILHSPEDELLRLQGYCTELELTVERLKHQLEGKLVTQQVQPVPEPVPEPPAIVPAEPEPVIASE